jgi:HlyD family secretion protein
MSKKLILVCIAIVAVVGGAVAWWMLSKPGLPPGFAGGNGRLEAKQIDISTKYPGRIKEVLANEGDTVDEGQVVATMDTEPLEAQLRAATAKIREAQDNRNTALAEVTVKQSEFDYADKQYRRSKDLVGRGAVSEQERDIDLARADASRAALVGARAQAVRTQSAIDAAQGEADRLAAEIKDNTLKSPIRARVQTRMAEPGEVLPAGGKVLSMADLSDVYMYVFLPANVSGKVALGSEARIVLDAIPEYPLRAVISFVSPSAQFTPKTVETAEERHNLSFRVKLQLDKERLRNYERLVKVGIPGMGYVRFDMNAAWPPKLESNPNAQIPWNPTGSTDSTGAASPAAPTDSTGAASSAASSTGPTGTQ